MSELVSNGVQIYQFPTEDGAVAELNSSMNVNPEITDTYNHYNTHIFLYLVPDNKQEYCFWPFTSAQETDYIHNKPPPTFDNALYQWD